MASSKFYTPQSTYVLDSAATLSQDVQHLEAVLAQNTDSSNNAAQQLREQGAHCQSYAILQLVTPLVTSVVRGTPVVSANKGGIVHQDAQVGDTSIQVMYVHDDVVATTSKPWDEIVSANSICTVGGSPNPLVKKCT